MSDINIFIFYAPEDQALLSKLETHLKLLKRQNYINNWYDRNIWVGSEWRAKVENYLNNAQIILLLISPDFVASDYSHSLEMKRAMELRESGKARVIPIVLRQVDWLGTTPFGNLVALPTGAKPVTSWKSIDDAFLNIAHGIRKVIEGMKTGVPEPSNVDEKVLSAKSLEVSSTEERLANPASRLGRERLDYLEQIIRRYYSSIRDAENTFRLSDDPIEKEQTRKSIDHQQSVAKDFLREYMELTNELGTIVPTDIIQISAKFSDTDDVSDSSYGDIRQALNKFSLRELRLLGLDLGVDVDMFPGEDVASKIVSLLDYMRQRARMDDLMTYLKRKHPTLFVK